MTAILARYTATRARRTSLMIGAAGLMVFIALFVVHFYLRAAAEEWPKAFSFPSLVLALALTSFAISSSVTCEIGAHALAQGDHLPAIRWLAISIVTWGTFAFVGIVEWVRVVFMLNLDWHTSFGASYLSIVITHWFGVCACALWLAIVAAKIKEHDILAVALFSHFLNLVWLATLVLIYFPNTNLIEGF